MFKSNSFSTKRAYDAPLCEALEFQINEGILDLSYGQQNENGAAAGATQRFNPYNEDF